jgi:hypothetical protein
VGALHHLWGDLGVRDDALLVIPEPQRPPARAALCRLTETVGLLGDLRAVHVDHAVAIGIGERAGETRHLLEALRCRQPAHAPASVVAAVHAHHVAERATRAGVHLRSVHLDAQRVARADGRVAQIERDLERVRRLDRERTVGGSRDDSRELWVLLDAADGRASAGGSRGSRPSRHAPLLG